MQLLETYPDEVLLTLLKDGNEKAFSTIYDRFSMLLFIYACRICKDENVAEDITQEIFIYLWDKRHSLEVKSSLSAYLYSSVRYKFLDLVDKQKVRSDYINTFKKFIDVGNYSTDDYINEKELKGLIEKEIAQLPSKMQEVFSLSRDHGLSHKEIAAYLSISEKTVKNQVTNALRILKGKLNNRSFIFLLFFY